MSQRCIHSRCQKRNFFYIPSFRNVLTCSLAPTRYLGTCPQGADLFSVWEHPPEVSDTLHIQRSPCSSEPLPHNIVHNVLKLNFKGATTQRRSLRNKHACDVQPSKIFGLR
ncbi:hypothetical protein V5799_003865 [Amblyomma americanum]|uniref:Uncharacterized protein n=1 Tax=Amblyomma americanum TaxID=6943 RepID=A0AAQ4D7R2_AMBAM